MRGAAVKLSPNFTLEELTFSATALRLGMANTPNELQISNLMRLCVMVLEPARALLGVPLHVDSGFRSRPVNDLVGGASDSAHLHGRAADIIPIGLDKIKAFGMLRTSLLLPFDQCIFEALSWVHLAIAPAGSQPRRQVLTARGRPGQWTYLPVA
jgi:zinc D-Ala-D-Ala carboxypeptidase